MHCCLLYTSDAADERSSVARRQRQMCIRDSTWIETIGANKRQKRAIVVPYIGTWIETESVTLK